MTNEPKGVIINVPNEREEIKMRVLLLIAIIITLYTLSYLSYCNEWEWFWTPAKFFTKIADVFKTDKIVDVFKTLVFIKAFPLLIKYRLNPFTITFDQLNATLSEKDKEKFITKVPKEYRNTLEEYLR